MIAHSLTQKASPFYKRLSAKGFEFQVTDDFNMAESLLNEVGRETQPMLSISRLDPTTTDTFWAFLFADGKAVASSAARYFELGRESLESYLRRTSRQQYRREDDPIEWIAPSLSSDLSGNIIYLGELQIKDQYKGHFSVAVSFVNLVTILAGLQFSRFDWMFAYIPFKHRRLIFDYGFSVSYRSPITWKEPVPPRRLNDHIIIAQSRAHFEDNWRVREPTHEAMFKEE